METWERQPEESTQAYEAFTVYREERSITKVAQRLDKSRTIIGQWSSEWKWVARCRDYDNALQSVDFEEKRAAIRDMHQRHLKLADVLQNKAMKALEQLDMADCSPRIVLEALKLSMEIERRSIYEEMADCEIRGEFDTNGGFNPAIAAPMLRVLADDRKRKQESGEDKDMVIIIDDVGTKKQDFSKLTPAELRTLRDLEKKCTVLEDVRDD